CSPDMPIDENPGLVLGAVLGQAALNGRDKLTILTDPEIRSFGSWLEQLIAESTGKQAKGIIPIDAEPPVAPSAYGQDRLFVYLRLSGKRAPEVDQLLKVGHPVITIALKDRYDLGAEFYRWEYATAVACAILGVNSFDQPDVQDNKDRTKQKIQAWKQRGVLEEGDPIWESAGAKVYGAPLPTTVQLNSLADVLEDFLQQAADGDYIALNAYLPRNQRTVCQLQTFRQRILDKTGCATMLGFGPRFLHSTGQLHKGGPDTGLFIQITRDPPRDLEIPGQNMGFGTLQRAQALGDLEALQSRCRRVIRIHLLSDRLDSLSF
ncbi:MAG: hypothetical protein U1B80_08995, partial [Anaerolineaceae bacterium]|nr:hypothetical protein [Anaerolineaceae bacterium]